MNNLPLGSGRRSVLNSMCKDSYACAVHEIQLRKLTFVVMSMARGEAISILALEEWDLEAYLRSSSGCSGLDSMT